MIDQVTGAGGKTVVIVDREKEHNWGPGVKQCLLAMKEGCETVTTGDVYGFVADLAKFLNMLATGLALYASFIYYLKE